MNISTTSLFIAGLMLINLHSDIAWAQVPAQPAPAQSPQLLKPEELDALVAPIALYPDSLLSLVLMASTYPLEVVEADRWVKENKNLKGDQLKAAVDKQPWDGSVKSLVATPDVLSTMDTKLDWTEKLGDAVLAQQPDVMDAIQRLRTKADANNKLTSTEQQRVTKKQEQGKQAIYIEQTDPNTVYVPYYDPEVVYGGWSYPAYPPYSFAWPGSISGGLIASGIAFGAGYALGRWASGGNYWGGGLNWANNNININRPRVNPLNGNNWHHNPAHRQGAARPTVQQGFGERPGAGRQPSSGQRPAAGQRSSEGQRRSAGRRPSAGRPHAERRPAVRRVGGFRGAGRRGGRRSDITLKHDIVLLGHLANGIGYYRFSYNGSDRAYVGVMAQEVQTVMPKAVVRDRGGLLRVFYDKLGIRFQTYEQWVASGARVPTAVLVSP